MQIQGKTAVVTGGASGLGAATARDLASAGARIAVLDLPRSEGEKFVAELGGGAIFCPCDVTVEEQVAEAVEKAADAFGGIHIDINCAGIGWAQRTVTRDGAHPLAPFQKVIEVNLFGTFNAMRLCAERMSSNDPDEYGQRGVIVNTASVAAFEGQIGQVAYSASKGGIVGMTLPAARDLASLGIRVCTIAPGLFNTPLLAGLPEPAREALAANIPFPKRLGEPAEYAALARSIVENPMLNGETIRLDGALRMPPKG
ncbi:MAG: 3-hydroxyacyl-CoA dehydrogenase [Deltaproteobacteria bacterium]|nr:3-hydroxyacyl-CoA dehydrogenase [Deltaproteobacteria bacterium]MBW2414970.1 3-hydroxyacyl-CoA dehydrogenase [Deltaproteobacteria bacterium]